MRQYGLATLVVLGPLLSAAHAYVEAPHTLGRCCHESSNIVLVEVTRVSQEKGLIIFKKLQDIKGKHAGDEIKHNIGKRGFHPREWQNIMNWAEVGKKAVFFHNGGASETCIGTYWYQCYKEGEWWGMSHAEPFLLRTYYGDPEKLAAAVGQVVQSKEVIVPCLADGNKNELHQRKGKLQRMKASLKLLDYNPRRDFVGWGGDGEEIVEYKTYLLLKESAPGWRFLPASEVKAAGDRWKDPEFDDRAWRSGQAPIGYGEEEIMKRKGTLVQEQGVPFVFRKEFDVPGDVLTRKDVSLRICVASDDTAVVFLNGTLVDKDPEDDHEFAYWNRDLELPAKQFKPGRNVVAALVRNKPKSSDIYFDMEVSAQVPLPKPSRKPMTTGTKPPDKPMSPTPQTDDGKLPPELIVDIRTKTVTVPCLIAPRRLPNLKEIYPIEVIATYPAPEGQKAHETVVTFKGIRPGHVHKALEQLGLKPGQPALGEGARAEGPEVRLYLEFTGAGGKVQRLPIEETLIERKTGKSLGTLKWHFTGSNVRQPDPEKDDKVYGANLTGTLVTIFPVTADAVIQSNLTMKEESALKLETNTQVLPKEGTPARLVIEVR